MKGIIAILITFVLLGGFVGTVQAANSAQQTVSFAIGAIDELSVSGNPGPMAIGANYAAATDATTSYAITTNGSGRKITGQINSDMPHDTTLETSLAAPVGGGSSLGFLGLSTTAVDLVSGIPAVAESGLTITYRFSATVAAGAVSGSRTVTLTLTN